MTEEYRGFRIKEIHAITGIDPEFDEEGIPSIGSIYGPMPLIASDHIRLEQLVKAGQAIANQTGQTFKIVRWITREEVGEIKPEERNEQRTTEEPGGCDSGIASSEGGDRKAGL